MVFSCVVPFRRKKKKIPDLSLPPCIGQHTHSIQKEERGTGKGKGGGIASVSAGGWSHRRRQQKSVASTNTTVLYILSIRHRGKRMALSSHLKII